MKTKVLIISIFLAVVPFTSAFAQELVPATSEDLEMFDRQLSETLRPDKAERKEPTKQNDPLGQAVSSEAKRLRENSEKDRKDFGKWISSQRRQNEQKQKREGGGESSAAEENRSDSQIRGNPHRGKKGKEKNDD